MPQEQYHRSTGGLAVCMYRCHMKIGTPSPYFTRALSSTKPSARCMALATCFNSSMQKRAGVAKGLRGPGRDRDEANVILA